MIELRGITVKKGSSSEAGLCGPLGVKVARDETSMPNNKKAWRETSYRSIGV